MKTKNLLQKTLQKFLSLLVISLAFTFLATNISFADTCTWTAAVNNNFSEPGNWNDCTTGGPHYPQSADWAILDGTSTADLNIDVNVDVLTFRLNAGYTGTASASSTQSFDLTQLTIADAGAHFDATNLNIDLAGTSSTAAFNFDAGEFTAPDGTHTFSATGGWDFENGVTFNHNNGSVLITGTFTSTIYDFVNNDLNFNNLEINLTDDTDRLQLGSGVDLDMHVAGILTLTNGVVDNRSGLTDGKLYADGSLSWGSGFDGGDAKLVFNMNAGLTSGVYTLPSDLDNSNYTTNGCFRWIIGDTNTLTVRTGSSTAFTCNLGILAVVGGTFDNRDFDTDFTSGGGINFGTIVANGGTIYTGAGDITAQGEVQALNGTIYVGESNTGTLTMENGIEISGGTFDASAAAGLTNENTNTTTSVDINSGTLISTPGIFILNGGWDQDGGTFTHSNGTVRFEGSQSFTFMDLPVSETFYNFELNKTNSTNIHRLRNGTADTYNIENDLTIIKGTLQADSGGATINLEGDFTLCPSIANSSKCTGISSGDASFDPSNRIVTLTGFDQAIYGDSPTFYILTKTTSAPETLYFEEGEEVTITNTLTLTGTSGNLLALESTGASSNTPASINPTGSHTINYVSIEDLNNTRGSDIDLSGNAENIDLGESNTGWIFAAPYVGTIPEFSTYLLILTLLAGSFLIYKQKNRLAEF